MAVYDLLYLAGKKPSPTSINFLICRCGHCLQADPEPCSEHKRFKPSCFNRYDAEMACHLVIITEKVYSTSPSLQVAHNQQHTGLMVTL
ncbi:hypothetical protein Bca4012_085717 [Brassica carinata]